MAGTSDNPTVLRDEADLPFVDVGDGNHMQLLQVDLAQGIWVVRNRFEPGVTVRRHRHTGHVHAFTIGGRWFYRESPEAVNTAGSYLFEPAGSTHTLTVPDNDGPTDVWFIIHGANLELDDDDRIDRVVDAHSALRYYRYECGRQHGMSAPPVVVVDAAPIVV